MCSRVIEICNKEKIEFKNYLDIACGTGNLSVKLANKFKQSEAFSECFMTLASDEDKLTEFINGCLPKSLLKEIEAENKKLREEINELKAA